MLFKAHTSNFKTIGFTEQVSIKELAACARKRGHPCVYDLGSGMLRRPQGLAGRQLPVEDELAKATRDGFGERLPVFRLGQDGVEMGRVFASGHRLLHSPIGR